MVMLMSLLMFGESQLHIDGIEVEADVIVLSISSTSPTGMCPLCGIPSVRIHSNYQRHPGDLPLAGYSFYLDMNVRKFFCDNDDCKRIIFTERLPSVLAPYARHTNRLADQQRQVAFALGGEAGSRLLAIMGMTVSPDTLLRLIRKTPESEIKAPRVLGVDEWAKRKGHSYGTILIDLETHKPVDLLPDKSAESFTKWLEEHPGVEIISRDRGKEYISGANEGAPDAIQVADRWHLLKNLRDTLEELLETKRKCLKAAVNTGSQDKPEQEASPVGKEQLGSSQNLTKKEKDSLARRAKRLERYKAVMELHQQGLYISEISRRLGLSWKTVNKYIKADECPVYLVRQKRRSKLDPYMDYMTQRWEAGCHNATQIWREIHQMGYSGKRRIVSEWATKRRKSLKSSHSKTTLAPWSPRRASWLFVKQKDELTEEEQQALERMKQAGERVAKAYTLGQCFIDMVREHQPESLLPWLEDASRSGINALKRFANGVKQDLVAVTNALSLPWSNGQTEGQVNRLKLIKRQMYGRANFDLLRKRVLATPLRC